jgi:hypothetical protein
VEASFQFTRQGKLVLVAAQTQIAVDNVFEKLPKHPEIRPLRLGPEHRISPLGQPFTEERVLAWFYQSIAKACRQKTIEPFTECSRELAMLQAWKKKAAFLHQDVEDLVDRSSKVESQLEAAHQQREAEEEKLHIQLEENGCIERERDSIKQFMQCLGACRGTRGDLRSCRLVL